MTESDHHFESFADHTDLKHLILTSYLRAWDAVTINPKAFPRGWFIDAFAGRGRDATGKPGSPLIACDVSREVDLKFAPASGLGHLKTYAIERDKDAFNALVSAAGTCIADGYVLPRFGTLEEHLMTVLGAGGRSDPRLFFLDPFGVKGLQADILGQILARPGAEVLLLFNDTGANRLHGAATKVNHTPVCDDTLTLFGDDHAYARGQDRVVAAQATGPAAEGILRRAFGDSAYHRATAAVLASAPSERPQIWRREYVQTLHELGAAFVVSFSVRDRAERHRYFLMHASTHRRAIHKMKEAIQTATRQHDAGAPQDALFYQTTVDVRTATEAVKNRFSGRTVRWTGKGEIGTVRDFLVEETDALLADLPAIEAEMQERGWLVQRKPRSYAFP